MKAQRIDHFAEGLRNPNFSADIGSNASPYRLALMILRDLYPLKNPFKPLPLWVSWSAGTNGGLRPRSRHFSPTPSLSVTFQFSSSFTFTTGPLLHCYISAAVHAMTMLSVFMPQFRLHCAPSGSCAGEAFPVFSLPSSHPFAKSVECGSTVDGVHYGVHIL